jgi:hypothetical protein
MRSHGLNGAVAETDIEWTMCRHKLTRPEY